MSGDALPVPVLESQYAAFESAGLVVIYSCLRSAPDAKRKLGSLAVNRFFDLSALELPAAETDAVRKILSLFISSALSGSASIWRRSI